MNKKVVFNILGVIVILTVLSIFIIPKVIDSFEEASQDGFVAQIQSIIRKINDDNIKNKSYTNATGQDAYNNKCNSSMKINLNHSDFLYSVTIDSNGKITKFNAKDINYEYTYVGDNLSIEDVVKEKVTSIKDKENLDLKICE